MLKCLLRGILFNWITEQCAECWGHQRVNRNQTGKGYRWSVSPKSSSEWKVWRKRKSLTIKPETHFMCGLKKERERGREWYIYANDCGLKTGAVCVFVAEPSEIISFDKMLNVWHTERERRKTEATSWAEDTGFRRKYWKLERTCNLALC